jgi:hypothetical protein
MNWLAIFFFVVAVVYLVAYFVEMPIFYEGNPKTRFFIEKLGKKGYKLLLLVFAGIFLVLAFIFK